jgi:outer membrane protein TolC
MMRKIVTYILVLLIGSMAFAQNALPVNIVKLSEVTLAESPIVKQNLLTIANAEGGFIIQKSTFDYQLFTDLTLSRTTLNLLGDDPRRDFVDGRITSELARTSIGLQKVFRSSLVANLTIDYDLTNNNSPFNIFNQNIGVTPDNHTVLSTFSLTQPLLRGRGRAIATALEEASKLSLEGADSNAVFANSFELFQMSSAYWQYVAANRNLEIFRENEARVRRVLEITQELVKADKRPAGDLAQVRADLANQERQTTVAEQLLFSAKLNLGRAIGLSEEDSELLGIPLDEFPSIEESGYTATLERAKFLKIAQENRADIIAAKKIQEALELELKFTENSKRPQLDLTGFINYGGMNMGNGLDRAIAAFSRNDGRNFGYGLRLSFSFPLNNNLAKGNYLRSQTALQNQEVVAENLQRNIDLNVSIALNNFENSVQILKKAKEALEYYQQVFNNEQIKFKNGMSIILNLIQLQERLTFAELDYLQAQQQFAESIVQLRFETGTLLVNTNDKSDINKDLFFTIPN